MAAQHELHTGICSLRDNNLMKCLQNSATNEETEAFISGITLDCNTRCLSPNDVVSWCPRTHNPLDTIQIVQAQGYRHALHPKALIISHSYVAH